jgi:NADH-quinone oxidoreductase subunit M
MQSFPWLTVLIAAPALGGLVVWLARPLHRFARPIALVWALAEVGVAVAATVAYTGDDGLVRLHEQVPWIEPFGVSYAVGVGGIGLTMILLATALVPLVLLAAWKEQPSERKSAHYAALVLVLEAFMVLVFAARDVFLFYVAFEAMLIPVYFLIGSFGGERRKAAALKFLLYSLAGGLIMLAGVIALWAVSVREADPLAGLNPEAFLVENIAALTLDTSTERLIFLSFFIAFAIKAPMFPVHTWLPDAAQAARPGTSVLLVGVLDKVGTFGMMTLCLPLFPAASAWAGPVVIALAVVSILWGAALALAQTDILRLIAYTSVSHFGFIVLGIFAFTQTAGTGAAFYMVNHGLATGGLFFLAGFLIQRRGTQRIDEMGPGLQRTTPVLAGTFLVVGLAAIALPGLAPFVSEFMVIVGAFQTNSVAAVIAAAGVVLAALYILLTYQKVFTGPVRDDLAGTPDLDARDLWVIGPLIAALIALGFYPAPALTTVSDEVAVTIAAPASAAAAASAPDVAAATQTRPPAASGKPNTPAASGEPNTTAAEPLAPAAAAQLAADEGRHL